MASRTSFFTTILCGIVSAVGFTEVTTYHIYLATGSSVLIPGLNSTMVNFTDEMIHELKKVGGTPEWLAQYHGSPIIHDAYSTRGQFFHQNKSFLLERLTKEDSGVYEQQVNHDTVIQVFLSVIDPVPQPTLKIQRDNNGSCIVLLQCLHPGGDQYNVTFLKDGGESHGNITKNSEISILLLDGTDPRYWGTYTCNVSNPISWNVSKELLVEPQGNPGEEVHFYVIVAVLVIYGIFFIIHVLWKIEQLNGYETLKSFLYIAQFSCGMVLECAALCILVYYGYHFRDEWRSLIGGILLFLSILLVRIIWCFLIKCGSPIRWITAAESALHLADFVLVPGILILETVIIFHDDDLCGMKMQKRWRYHLYLEIVMAALLLVVCLFRLCQKSHPSPLAQGQQKVPLVGIPANNEAAEGNSEASEGQARSANDPDMTDEDEEEDGTGRGTAHDEEEEEHSTDNIQDPETDNRCQEIMDNRADNGQVTDTEKMNNERLEEEIPLQDDGCME